MMPFKIWKLELEFKDGQHVTRFVKSDRLRLGRHPKCEFRHSQFEKDVELELETLAPDDVHVSECAFGVIRVSDLTRDYWDHYAKQWDGRDSHGADLAEGGQSPILWHFRRGILISTSLLEDYATGRALTTGIKLTWRQDDPYTLLIQDGDDLRSAELVRTERGQLVAEVEDERFVVTQAEALQHLKHLEHPEWMEAEPKSRFNRALLGALLSWIVLVFIVNFASGLLPQEVVDEALPPEIAKVTIEKAPRGKVAKGGGNGQEGGGGVETVTENDPRGGSGQVDEAVVTDKAIFGGAKIMNALSALDEGMNTGKVAAAGIPAIQSKGSTSGILGALASLTGKGGGKNGLGLGGLGTRGFGGGGGGGRGGGFGTGVGAGLGKGEGLRNISFDNDAASVRGGLEKSEVDAVVKENFSQVRYCYNKALRNHPELQGKLISNFVIGSDGSVTSSRIKDSTLGVVEVENCVKQRVATWRFPTPRGGSTVEVSYPFLLKSF